MTTYIDIPTMPLPDSCLQKDIALGNVHTSMTPTIMPEAAGFLPLREDFDIDWDNDAEEVVKDVVLQDDDLPIDVALKTAIIESYNRALDERGKMRDLVIMNGLLDGDNDTPHGSLGHTGTSMCRSSHSSGASGAVFGDGVKGLSSTGVGGSGSIGNGGGTAFQRTNTSTSMGRAASTDVQAQSQQPHGTGKYAVCDELARFAKLFRDHKAYKCFVDGLRRERRLRRRIETLQNYRTLGLTDWESVDKFKQDSRVRDEAKKGCHGNLMDIRRDVRGTDSSLAVSLQGIIIEAADSVTNTNRPSEEHASDSDRGSQTTRLDDAYDLLNAGELQACEDNGFTPVQYITVKSLLLTSQDSLNEYVIEEKKERIKELLVKERLYPETTAE